VSNSAVTLPLHQLEPQFIEQHLLATTNKIDTVTSSIELVVLSDISLALLSRLIDHCQLSVLVLNAVNQRHNLQSYRFSVNLQNISAARIKLVEFAKSHQLEAILIDNAPHLNQPGLLVMDMDSTTIEIECIDEIAALAGVGKQVAEVTELAMQGKLDFAQSLHQRVATLANAPETILAEVAKNLPLMPGLTSLIKTLKTYNWRIAIASGGFTYFSEHLKAELDLDDTFANTLEIIDGRLTGKVLGDVVDAQAKANTIKQLQQKYQLDKTQTVAMGDGANDLLMMAQAHLGVAFHAKPVVLAQADTCIHSSGLDLLIHWLK
jgi:phosphoserine phosphatase